MSGNRALISNLKISYASPDSAGTLTFKPAPKATGTAVITVTVNNGGKSNNLVTQTFTVVVAKTVSPVSPAIVNPLADHAVVAGQSALAPAVSNGPGSIAESLQTIAAVVPTGQSVTMAWSPSADTNVTGYNLYYGVTSGTYTNKTNVGSATNATVSGLIAGVTYYFAVTAYDAFGQESAYSSEISYLVPSGLASVQVSSAPAGQSIVTVSGPAGHTYQILASPDLKVWTVIGNVTVGASGSLNFTDTNAAAFTQRFYRTQG